MLLHIILDDCEMMAESSLMTSPESYTGKAEIGSIFQPGLDSASTENKKKFSKGSETRNLCLESELWSAPKPRKNREQKVAKNNLICSFLAHGSACRLRRSNISSGICTHCTAFK